MRKPTKNTSYDAYIKNCEKGFPKWIYWQIIAGTGPLTYAQQQDLVFDERDYKIRGLKVPEEKKIDGLG